MGAWVLIPIFLPITAGVLSLLPICKKQIGDDDNKQSLRVLHVLVTVVLVVAIGFAMYAAWGGERSYTLLTLTEGMSIYFHVDEISQLFVSLISVIWILVAIYAYVYMKHEGRERQFFGFYMIVYGVLMALSFSGNLVTMYLFYEIMTLTSMPLVLHSRTHESIMAALKYLFYSMCGAYLGLFGIFILNRYCDTLTFTAGGVLDAAAVAGNTGLILAAIFAAIIGFGAKAGMFPLHAWLPTAHPVAPAPASACLSGIIAKMGVLAIIRLVFYVVGADFLRGTWVQYAWMTLTLLTVFMGSMMAFREKVFKKRLAYSTVSQVSYILFGLSVLDPAGMEGALLHVVFHALIKSCLFLSAGAVIFKTGKDHVDQLEGIGKTMPKMLWCYTFASLALVGIPPTCGFVSKWFLAEGALEADIGVFSWIGPAVLLLSALLTAGYLLTIVTNGFFPKKKEKELPEKEANELPGEEAAELTDEAAEEAPAQATETVSAQATAEAATAEAEKAEPAEAEEETLPSKSTKETDISMGMFVPMVILAALTVLLGVFPGQLISFVSGIAALVF